MDEEEEQKPPLLSMGSDAEEEEAAERQRQPQQQVPPPPNWAELPPQALSSVAAFLDAAALAALPPEGEEASVPRPDENVSIRCLPFVCKAWARAFQLGGGDCGPSHLSLKRNRWSVLPARGGFHQQQQGQGQQASTPPPPPLARVVPKVSRFVATARSVKIETGFLAASNPVAGSAAARAAFEAAGLSDPLDAAAEARNAAIVADAAGARAFWEADVAPVRALLDSREPRGARLRGVKELSVLFHRRPVAPLLTLLFFPPSSSGEEGGGAAAAAGGAGDDDVGISGGGGGLSRAPALESLTLVRPRADPTDSPAPSSKGGTGISSILPLALAAGTALGEHAPPRLRRLSLVSWPFSTPETAGTDVASAASTAREASLAFFYAASIGDDENSRAAEERLRREVEAALAVSAVAAGGGEAEQGGGEGGAPSPPPAAPLAPLRCLAARLEELVIGAPLARAAPAPWLLPRLRALSVVALDRGPKNTDTFRSWVQLPASNRIDFPRFARDEIVRFSRLSLMFPALEAEEPWSVALSPPAVSPPPAAAARGEGDEQEGEEEVAEEEAEGAEEYEEEEGEAGEVEPRCAAVKVEVKEEQEARIERVAAAAVAAELRRQRRAAGPTLKSVLASAFGDSVTSLSIDAAGRSAHGGRSRAPTKSRGVEPRQPEPQKQQSFEFVSKALLALPNLRELAVRTLRPTPAMPGEPVVLFDEEQAREDDEDEGEGEGEEEPVAAAGAARASLTSLDVRGLLGRGGLLLPRGPRSPFRKLVRLDLRGQVSQWDMPLPRYAGSGGGGGAPATAVMAARPPPIAFLPKLRVLLFGFSEASPYRRLDLAALLAGMGDADPQEIEELEEEEEEEEQEGGEGAAGAAEAAALQSGGGVSVKVEGGGGAPTSSRPRASSSAAHARAARARVPPSHAYPSLRLIVLERCELGVGEAALAEALALSGGGGGGRGGSGGGRGGPSLAAARYISRAVPTLMPELSRLHLHGCSFAPAEEGGEDARELARGLAVSFASAGGAGGAARGGGGGCKETCFGCQAFQGESEGEWAPLEMRW